MAKQLAAARAGFRRFFSIAGFTPPPAATVPPPADPSPNLFVSGLNKRTTSEGLREAFSKFGNIIHARVVTDRVSNYSKGFGFVSYATMEEADEGIKGMDGKFLDGWVIFAEYAKPRPHITFQGQSSQPTLNTSSTPPSNYTSQTSQASAYFSSHSSHTPQEIHTPSNFSHPSQASQPPNYPPSSHTSAPPYSFSSEASNPENSSARPSSYLHQQPEYTSSYASAPPNNPPQNSEIPSGNTAVGKYQISKPQSDLESGLAADY